MSAKCGSCTKTVYPMDPQISLDGCIFHKTCAKCSDCNCQITISNFTKNGTTLLCKTHYFQRFRVEGNYLGGEKYSQKSTRDNGGISPVRGRSPVPAASPPPPAAEDDPTPTMSVKDRMKKFGSAGVSNKVACGACDGNVFPNDAQITLDGIKFHKECAKCADCKCQITIANFTKSDKLLLCKIHYNERFSKEGSYVGGDKFAKKTGRNAYSPVPPAASAPMPSSAEFAPVAPAMDTEVTAPIPAAVEPAPEPPAETPAPSEEPAPEPAAEIPAPSAAETPAAAEEPAPEPAAEIPAPSAAEIPAAVEEPAAESEQTTEDASASVEAVAEAPAESDHVQVESPDHVEAAVDVTAEEAPEDVSAEPTPEGQSQETSETQEASSPSEDGNDAEVSESPSSPVAEDATEETQQDAESV